MGTRHELVKLDRLVPCKIEHGNRGEKQQLLTTGRSTRSGTSRYGGRGRGRQGRRAVGLPPLRVRGGSFATAAGSACGHLLRDGGGLLLRVGGGLGAGSSFATTATAEWIDLNE
jgi:hypothetical protein